MTRFFGRRYSQRDFENVGSSPSLVPQAFMMEANLDDEPLGMTCVARYWTSSVQFLLVP